MDGPRFEEVADGVYRQVLPIPFEDGWVSSYLFEDGPNVDLVDCGMRSELSVELLGEAVRRVGGPAARVRNLVVTHIHPDHYGAAGVVAAEWGARLHLHRLEVPIVRPRYVDLEMLLADVGRYLLDNGVPPAEAAEVKDASRALVEYVVTAEPSVVLEGAETLTLGRYRVKVLWTPGHSPGHICLQELGGRFVVVGDQLLPDTSPNVGLHPQSTPNPLDDYLESLRRLQSIGMVAVFPAHGEPFLDPAPRAAELIGHHERRKARMLELIGSGEVTAWEVAVGTWGPRDSPHDRRLALQEALAHLQSMAVAGLLTKEIREDSRVIWRGPQSSSRGYSSAG